MLSQISRLLYIIVLEPNVHSTGPLTTSTRFAGAVIVNRDLYFSASPWA